eukprot:Skav217364  [mRNA]  locus=scaffold3931:60210:60566:- [translate_table: standard]
MTEEVRPVFSTIPTASDLEKLKIGASPPSSACTVCDGSVRVYSTGQTIDKESIFEHQGKFYSNKESVVVVSGFEFRNPPVFLPTVSAEPRHSFGHTGVGACGVQFQYVPMFLVVDIQK